MEMISEHHSVQMHHRQLHIWLALKARADATHKKGIEVFFKFPFSKES